MTTSVTTVFHNTTLDLQDQAKTKTMHSVQDQDRFFLSQIRSVVS